MLRLLPILPLLGLAISGSAHAEPLTRPVTAPTSATGITAAPESSTTPADDLLIFVPDDDGRSSDSQPADARRVDLTVDTVSIIGDRRRRARIAGSAHTVTAEELERMEYNDVHRIMSTVPGVYVRGEEGYGLRPNIGLRGANSDRSSKVALMEDGVLLAPAPYAAPAAYYFPLMTRMQEVEVFKGPAAIRYGPNTIGGAVNFLTRKTPTGPVANADAAYGTFDTRKAHIVTGTGDERWGILLEGVNLGTRGFKQIDFPGDKTRGRLIDTGFDKNEVMLKGRWNSALTATTYRQVELKLGYSDEHGNQSYLGLTDADFASDPYRRYAASQYDVMQWRRLQAEARYFTTLRDDLDLQIVGYRHDFTRDWTKLNGFRDGTELGALLANPNVGRNAVLYRILTGREDSVTPDQALLIGSNDRTFAVQGLFATSHWRHTSGPVTGELEAGIRWHYDRIERDHTEKAYRMQNGTLVPEDARTQRTSRNRGRAVAWALHLVEDLQIGRWTVAPGIRYEWIDTSFLNHLTGDRSMQSTQVWLPGVGFHWQATRRLGVLAGVHKGFSPVSPGQPKGVEPESSINYELGSRYTWPLLGGELIGFFNDYRNLTGECRLSSGCNQDVLYRQFNAGAVHVYGLESVLTHLSRPVTGVRIDAKATYTLTRSRFLNAFTSFNPQFGQVEVGDELPYVPRHQGSFDGNLTLGSFSIGSVLKYQGTMRDVAGQGPPDAHEEIPGYWLWDLSLGWQVRDWAKLYGTAYNLTDRKVMVSRRPYGARAGRPRHVMIGIKLDLHQKMGW